MCCTLCPKTGWLLRLLLTLKTPWCFVVHPFLLLSKPLDSQGFMWWPPFSQDYVVSKPGIALVFIQFLLDFPVAFNSVLLFYDTGLFLVLLDQLNFLSFCFLPVCACIPATFLSWEWFTYLILISFIILGSLEFLLKPNCSLITISSECATNPGI